LEGLESQQSAAVKHCLTALEKLELNPNAEQMVPVLALLRRLLVEPKRSEQRQWCVTLINRLGKQNFTIKEQAGTPEELRTVYQPIFDWFAKMHPKLSAKLDGADGEDPAHWDQVLAKVDWSKGVAERGEKLFRERACATCHAGTTRIGPDLSGIAKRFSREDLFKAILYPHRDVAPAFRQTVIETKQGQVFTGIIVFFSADGVIMQTGAATTVRIADADIENRAPSNKSLMPTGLLKDLKAEDLSDLYAYLQSLKASG
jgi:putative heme-binding domain-containing protein